MVFSFVHVENINVNTCYSMLSDNLTMFKKIETVRTSIIETMFTNLAMATNYQLHLGTYVTDASNVIAMLT